MTSYKFGDVVLVPFPFTDQKSSKKRPAVVISSDVYHHQRPDLILVAVTSQVRPSTLIGEMTITDWREAGLLKSSIIKPVLTTVEKSLVIRKLGQLQNGDRQALRNTLQAILGE